MSPPLFFLIQWFKFKRAVRVTNNKVRTAKIAISRAAKDQVPSLLGFSQLKLPEPPCPQLLQSNTPPTDLEETEIHKAISTVEAQALHLQEIIQEHGTDSRVEHELDLARQFVHAHRGILSAIRRIPPAVLQEIFGEIIFPWQDDGWNTIPWVLSQVCQQWRATALSMTSLWSNHPGIDLSRKTPRSYVAKIEELLVRSRDAPINFYLSVLDKYWESHPVIDALTRHSYRWQAVIIDCTNLTNFALKGVKGRLSSLRTLSLDIQRQTEPVVFDVFEDAPQLREVHVGGKFHGEFRLPFSQLTRYKERVRGRGMVDHTISLATSLTVLEISRSFESPDIPFTTLPFLVVLKVQFDKYQPGFLDRLTLPVIQDLWIAGYPANLITEIIDMISRSQSPCILKKFVFRVSGLSGLDSRELSRLLRLTSNLTALNLALSLLEDLASFMSWQNTPPLVPLLQTLTIEADTVHRPETRQLLNAIAVSQCSLQDSLASTVPHFLGGRLQELRIIFQKTTDCHYELSFLEGWVPSEDSKQLVIWKEKLLRAIREPGSREPDPKLRHRVFDIFSDIEKFHVKDVNDIYISEIHIALRRFTNRPVTTSILSQFGDRAGEILAKWTPLFESHLKDRRWVLSGESSLVCLSTDDALRTSPTSLDIVYGLKDDGLKDDIRFPERSWHTHMLD